MFLIWTRVRIPPAPPSPSEARTSEGGYFYFYSYAQFYRLPSGLRWRNSTYFVISDMHTVYILKCSDQTYYVGCTSNLENRLIRYHRGEVNYTKSRLPVNVENTINFKDKYTAYNFEKYLKTGSGIAFRNKRLIS